MPKIKVIVTGVRELDAMLRRLPLKVQKKAIRPALRDGAKAFAAAARQEAPKDTGALKSAIDVRATTRSRKKIGVNVVLSVDRFPLLASREGGGFFYPAAVEYGVKSANRPPDRFMARAFDRTVPQARARLFRDVRAAITRLWNAGA